MRPAGVLSTRIRSIVLFLAVLAGPAHGQRGAGGPAELAKQDGQAYVDKKEWDKALPHLERAVELNPKFYEALVPLGWVYYQLGRYDDAAKTAEAALRMGKDFLPCLTLAMAEEKRGRTAQALEAYEQALRAKKGDAESLRGKARLLTALGKNKEAVDANRELQKAAAGQPHVVVLALKSEGELLQKLGDAKGAQKAFEKILEISPESAVAPSLLAPLYFEAKQHEKAIDMYRRVLKFDNDQASIHLKLAESCRAAGRAAEALEHATTAVRLDPGASDAKRLMLDLLMGEGRTDEALQGIDGLLAITDGDAQRDLYETKIQLLRKIGQADQAGLTVDEALAKFPQHGPFIRPAVFRRLKENKQDEALKLAQQLRAQDPNGAASQSLAAAVLLAAGKLDEARQVLQAALKLDPAAAELHVNLGYVEARKGELDAARPRFEEAVRLSPTSVAAQNNLAASHLPRQPDKAKPALSAAQKAGAEVAAVRANLALVQALGGQLRPAREVYAKLAEANPKDSEILRNYGLILAAEGRLVEAATALEQASKLSGADVGLQRLLADIYAASPARQEVAEKLYRGLADKPGGDVKVQAMLAYNHGTILLALQRNDDAAAALKKATQLDPTMADAFNNLGCAYFHAKRTELAREAFRQAMQLKPDVESFLLNALAAGSEVDLGRATSAKAASQAIEVLRAKGYAALESKQYSEAARYLEQVWAKDHSSAALANALGVALVQLKRYDEARDRFAAALQLKPDLGEALLNLALLLDRQFRQEAEALDLYEKFLKQTDDAKIRRYVQLRRRLRGLTPS